MDAVATQAQLAAALEREAAISDLLRTMARSGGDLRPVLDAVCEYAKRICHASFAVIWRVDGDVAHFEAGATATKEWLEHFQGRALPLAESFMVRGTVERRAPFYVGDVIALRTDDAGAASARLGGYRSALGVPLFQDDTITGVLTVARTEISPFSEQEVELLRTFGDQVALATQTGRLLDEVRRMATETRGALEKQSAIADVLQVISRSAFDLQRVLDTLVENAARLTDAKHSLLFRLEGEHYRLVASFGNRPEFRDHLQTQPIAVNPSTLVGRTVLAGEPVRIADVLADPEYTWGSAQKLGAYRSVLGVPMLRDGVPIGVIAVFREEVHGFADREVELLVTFADQAVIAIENVRLFNETKDALARQEAFAQVLQTISRSAFDLQAVLETIIQNSVRLCDARGGLIFRRTSDGYRLAAAHGGSPGLVEYFRKQVLQPGQEAVTMRAVLHGGPIQIQDVLADPQYEHASVREFEAVRTVLGIPLLHKGEFIGAMSLWRNEVREFDSSEVELVTTFADQAAIALENAHLLGEIREKSAELERANRHKSEFLANMSHELRTPLNAIIGFSEVLSQGMAGPVNERQAEYLGDVLESGRHLLSLINDILDLAKVESGRMELDLSSFSLPALLESAVGMLRERAQRRAVSMTLEVAGGVETVTADERKVKQILFNLLSNAVKFSPEGGAINVRAHREDSEVLVSVEDSGAGVQQSDQERIFEEFVQTGEGRRASEGTGLGLSLARRLALLHGGRLWVESEPGHGSIFTFAIPSAPAEAASAGR